jgi:hypothetical protein
MQKLEYSQVLSLVCFRNLVFFLCTIRDQELLQLFSYFSTAEYFASLAGLSSTQLAMATLLNLLKASIGFIEEPAPTRLLR